MNGFQKQTPNCIYKFAVTPKDISKLDIFLKDLAFISKANKVIGIAMGKLGSTREYSEIDLALLQHIAVLVNHALPDR